MYVCMYVCMYTNDKRIYPNNDNMNVTNNLKNIHNIQLAYVWLVK